MRFFLTKFTLIHFSSLMHNRIQLEDSKKVIFKNFFKCIECGMRLRPAAQKTIEICLPAAAAAACGRKYNQA